MTGFVGPLDKGYWRVESTAIAEVSSVRLYNETWDVLQEKHPELKTVGVEGVLGTVQNPSRIYPSRTEGSFLFVNDEIAYLNAPMLVAVRLVKDSSCRVATAYFRSNSLATPTLWDRGDAG